MIPKPRRTRHTRSFLAALLGLLALGCHTVPLTGNMLFSRVSRHVSLSQARLRVAYSLRRGTFTVTRVRNSIRLRHLATAVKLDGRRYASTDRTCNNTLEDHSGLKMVIRSAVEDGPAWETCFEIRIHPDEGNPTLDKLLVESYGVALSCRLIGGSSKTVTPKFYLTGEAQSNRLTFAGRLEKAITSPTAHIATGGNATGQAADLYDPRKGCAVHFEAPDVKIGLPQKRLGGRSFPVQVCFASTASMDFVEGLRKMKTAGFFRHPLWGGLLPW